MLDLESSEISCRHRFPDRAGVHERFRFGQHPRRRHRHRTQCDPQHQHLANPPAHLHIGQQVTDGGTSGTSALYWQGSAPNGNEQTGANGILSVVANPATNGGAYAEISIAILDDVGTLTLFVSGGSKVFDL